MKVKLLIIIAVVMAMAVLIVAACGRGRRGAENNGQINENIAVIQEMPHSAPDGAVFTISAPFGNQTRLRDSADVLQKTLAEQGVHVQIDIMSYLHNERESHYGLLLSKYAAGIGPDIFIRDNFLLYPFIENGFLADIYSIIDQSGQFGRDDFFTNVLEGLEVNGKLYMLPLQFGIDFIGINKNAPQSIKNKFEALDRAVLSEITAIYLDLIKEYPKWAEKSFIHNLTKQQMFLPEFNNSIDFVGRTADFSGSLGLLENIRLLFKMNGGNSAPTFNWQSPLEDLAAIEVHYVFNRVSMPDAGIYGLFDFKEPSFINYIPLADENGRLVNYGWGTEFVVSHAANPDLAIGFIGQFISDRMPDDFRIGQNIPILKQYFRQGLEAGFRNTLAQMKLPEISDPEGLAIEKAIARMEEYSKWPSTTFYTLGYVIPPDLLFIALSEFLSSEMPLEDAADEMEAAITAWLNEERPKIEPFIDEPAKEEKNMPARSLTIRTTNMHTGVIEQAAAAMNDAWLNRGEPYTFQVEVQDHPWTDFEWLDDQVTRLQTELMAGLGPDMFIFERHNIHSLAASGYLRDIYTLMDSDPNTSRDEFFTQALKAYEINNGLYLFPTSLEFEYVAVNAKLPPEFIDRFVGMETISIVEIMEFYLDLMDSHGDEFGHLVPDTAGRVLFSRNALQSVMGSFIDFNSRASNLTDPRFIYFLELAGRVYADWEAAGWGVSSSTVPFLRERANESVFYIKSGGLNSFDAFFKAEPPIFMHYIPLVDDHGKLMLGIPGIGTSSIWSGICITSAGDGDLAWELTRHMIYAYTNPVGRAAVDPVFGAPAPWGNQSLAAPIMRSLFRGHILRTFEDYVETWGYYRLAPLQTYVGFDDPISRALQFENAINRIAAYNEQPMGLLSPMIPRQLFREPFNQFLNGLIDAETAAHRMHNAISLWLIE